MRMQRAPNFLRILKPEHGVHPNMNDSSVSLHPFGALAPPTHFWRCVYIFRVPDYGILLTMPIATNQRGSVGEVMHSSCHKPLHDGASLACLHRAA